MKVNVMIQDYRIPYCKRFQSIRTGGRFVLGNKSKQLNNAVRSMLLCGDIRLPRFRGGKQNHAKDSQSEAYHGG